jgi:hypothetical protein
MDKAVSGAWKKALEGLQFSMRRLDAKQREEIAEANAAVMKIHGQLCFNDGWNRAISTRYAKAAPGSATAAPVTVMPAASPDVHVHIDKGAIAVQNVIPSDLRVRVDQVPRELDVLRDANGNITGVRG